MKDITRSIFLVLGTFFLITTCVHFSWAQTSRGAVAGTVADQNGAVISGADVELRKAATNETRVTRTNDSGIYRFDAVDLGTYEVTVKATGFKTSTINAVQVRANQTAQIDAEMEVGTEQIVVTISAAGDLLQTSEPVKGGNFTP